MYKTLKNDNSNEEQDSKMLYWVFLAPHTTIKQKKYTQIDNYCKQCFQVNQTRKDQERANQEFKNFFRKKGGTEAVRETQIKQRKKCNVFHCKIWHI